MICKTNAYASGNIWQSHQHFPGFQCFTSVSSLLRKRLQWIISPVRPSAPPRPSAIELQFHSEETLSVPERRRPHPAARAAAAADAEVNAPRSRHLVSLGLCAAVGGIGIAVFNLKNRLLYP